MVILFDLDGTLIDSTPAIVDGFIYTFKKFNLTPPSEDKIKSLIGYPLDYMFKNLGVEENIEDFVNSYKSRYKEIFKEKTTLLPNAKEAITLASTFARLGIVTTKTGKYSRELMEFFEVMEYFDVLIGREDVIHPKPHPEPILKAIYKLKADKNHTFMVGDTCLDMVSAKEAGIRAVAVEWEYEKNLKECSEIIKKDVLEAVKFIKGLNERA